MNVKEGMQGLSGYNQAILKGASSGNLLEMFAQDEESDPSQSFAAVLGLFEDDEAPTDFAKSGSDNAAVELSELVELGELQDETEGRDASVQFGAFSKAIDSITLKLEKISPIYPVLKSVDNEQLESPNIDGKEEVDENVVDYSLEADDVDEKIENEEKDTAFIAPQANFRYDVQDKLVQASLIEKSDVKSINSAITEAAAENDTTLATQSLAFNKDDANVARIPIASKSIYNEVENVIKSTMSVGAPIDEKPYLAEVQPQNIKVNEQGKIEILEKFETSTESIKLEEGATTFEPKRNIEPTMHSDVKLTKIEESFEGIKEKIPEIKTEHKDTLDNIKFHIEKRFNGDQESIKFTLRPKELGQIEIKFENIDIKSINATKALREDARVVITVESENALNVLNSIRAEIEEVVSSKLNIDSSFSLELSLEDKGQKNSNNDEKSADTLANEYEKDEISENYVGEINLSENNNVNLVI